MKKILFVVLGAIVVAGLAAAVVLALVAPRGTDPVPLASAAASASPTAPPSTVPTPEATSRSSATPSATPNDSGVATEPVFGSGSATASVECPVPGEGPAGSTAESPEVQLTWSSSGTETAYVGVDTTDAQAEPYQSVSTSGSISIPFACPAASHAYTITLVGPGGARSKTFTVPNTGYRG